MIGSSPGSSGALSEGSSAPKRHQGAQVGRRTSFADFGFRCLQAVGLVASVFNSLGIRFRAAEGYPGPLRFAACLHAAGPQQGVACSFFSPAFNAPKNL